MYVCDCAAAWMNERMCRMAQVPNTKCHLLLICKQRTQKHISSIRHLWMKSQTIFAWAKCEFSCPLFDSNIHAQIERERERAPRYPNIQKLLYKVIMNIYIYMYIDACRLGLFNDQMIQLLDFNCRSVTKKEKKYDEKSNQQILEKRYRDEERHEYFYHFSAAPWRN